MEAECGLKKRVENPLSNPSKIRPKGRVKKGYFSLTFNTLCMAEYVPSFRSFRGPKTQPHSPDFMDIRWVLKWSTNILLIKWFYALNFVTIESNLNVTLLPLFHNQLNHI